MPNIFEVSVLFTVAIYRREKMWFIYIGLHQSRAPSRVYRKRELNPSIFDRLLYDLHYHLDSRNKRFDCAKENIENYRSQKSNRKAVEVRFTIRPLAEDSSICQNTLPRLHRTPKWRILETNENVCESPVIRVGELFTSNRLLYTGAANMASVRKGREAAAHRDRGAPSTNEFASPH